MNRIPMLSMKMVNRKEALSIPHHNVATGILYEHFQPEVVFLDEASKATEADVVIVMAHYAPRCFVLAGDDRQLPPTVLSHHQSTSDGKLANYFSGQLVKSLFRRFNSLGHPRQLCEQALSILHPSIPPQVTKLPRQRGIHRQSRGKRSCDSRHRHQPHNGNYFLRRRSS